MQRIRGSLTEQFEDLIKGFTEGVDNNNKNFLDHEMELKQILGELEELRRQTNDFLTKKDGIRFWRQLQRFSEYEDLKDLYQKVIPEISKFEQRIIDFEDNMNRCNVIIRNFDENISTKCDKLLLEQLRSDIQTNYALIESQQKFMTRIDDQIGSQDEAIKN